MLPDQVLPVQAVESFLVVIPQAPKTLLKRYQTETKGSWPQGVYLTSEGWGLGIVLVDQLPKTPETLWLRLWGRGRVQRQAMEEVSLPCQRWIGDGFRP